VREPGAEGQREQATQSSLTALAIVEPILSNARDEVGDLWRRARVRQTVPLQRNRLVVFGRSLLAPNEGGHRRADSTETNPVSARKN
jgi:hypothetical protein